MLTLNVKIIIHIILLGVSHHDENDNDLIDFIGFDNEFIFYHKEIEIKIVRKSR